MFLSWADPCGICSRHSVLCTTCPRPSRLRHSCGDHSGTPPASHFSPMESLLPCPGRLLSLGRRSQRGQEPASRGIPSNRGEESMDRHPSSLRPFPVGGLHGTPSALLSNPFNWPSPSLFSLPSPSFSPGDSSQRSSPHAALHLWKPS